MNLRNRRALKDAADQSLRQASYDPRKIILIHAGAALGLTLLLTIVNFVLDNQIDSTGGLSGLGVRSVLSTIQSVLKFSVFAVLPFWDMGYIYSVMKIARNVETSPTDLLQGFRRFGAVLRWLLLRGLIFFAIAIGCLYLSNQIFILTPLSNPVIELLEPYLDTSLTIQTAPVFDDATVAAMMDAFMPMVIIFAVLYLLVAIPLVYKYRLSGYALMDLPERGALAALRNSRAMMRHNCVALFRLDLSFWWYYLLQAILSLIAYGDVILNLLGFQLPWGAQVSFFVFYVLFLIGQLVVFFFFRNKVEVTYVNAYDTLHEPVYHRPDPVPPYQQPWQN